MKPPLWLILHAAAHASMASTEQLFLLVTEPRSGSDWLVDLLDAHPHVCVPAGRWAEKGSNDDGVVAMMSDLSNSLRTAVFCTQASYAGRGVIITHLRYSFLE